MRKTHKLFISLFSITILLILSLNYKVNSTTITNIPNVSNFDNFETKIDNETIKPSFSTNIAEKEKKWSRQFNFTINQSGYILIRSVAKTNNLNDNADFEISVNSKNLTKEYASKSAYNKSVANSDLRVYLEKGTYTILLTDNYTYTSNAQTLSTYLGFLPANKNILSAQYVSDSAKGQTIKLQINSLDKISTLRIDNSNYSGKYLSGDIYTLDSNNCVTIGLKAGSRKDNSYPYIKIKVVDIFGFEATKTYTILNNFTADITGIINKTYTGLPIKQTNYNVKNSYTNLAYTVSYKNNINKGTATIIFKGTKDTLGTATKTFKINPMNASSCKVSLSTTSYTYNGKVKTPSIKVKNSKNQTISKNNYTISYAKGRKNVGKYKISVKFKGNYTGTKTLYFTIKPKTTKISSIKRNKSNKVTIKWRKQATQVSGYQLQYSTNNKFKKAKTITINKNSTTSKTISNLSKNKKYYLRIRTFKKIGKAKYYSSWK